MSNPSAKKLNKNHKSEIITMVCMLVIVCCVHACLHGIDMMR